MINIALYQPDIPQNTAAIIRTCSCLNIRLEIIKPTGFILNEKKLDRVYLDYLENCQIIYHESFEEFLETKDRKNIILFTTKSKKQYYNHSFKEEDTLLFGSESKGVQQNLKIDTININLKKRIRYCLVVKVKVSIKKSMTKLFTN